MKLYELDFLRSKPYQWEINFYKFIFRKKYRLTKQQSMVAALKCGGLSIAEICYLMKLSDKGVKFHVTALIKAFGIKTSSGLFFQIIPYIMQFRKDFENNDFSDKTVI